MAIDNECEELEAAALLQVEESVGKSPHRTLPRCRATAFLISLAIAGVFAILMFARSPRSQAELTAEPIAATAEFESTNDVPNIVWAFWFGPTMAGNRKSSFEKLKVGLNIPVRLVTIDTLHKYNSSRFPIHKAFHLLTDIHKADYLRAYFAHVHGGGYHDVKAPTEPDGGQLWPHFRDKLWHNKSVWLAGGSYTSIACDEKNLQHLHVPYCEELRASGKVQCCPTLYNDILSGKISIPDVQGFIARRNTPLTRDWIEMVHAKLDSIYESLVKHPGTNLGRCCAVFDDGNPLTNDLDPSGYPLLWNELCGAITTAVFAKYRTHIAMGLPVQPKGAYFRRLMSSTMFF